MMDEYLPDDSSTTAAEYLSAKARGYFGRIRRSKEHHGINARGTRSPYLLSREMLALVAGPWIKNAAVQIQNIAFGDDVETGVGGSRRCCSLAQAREEDLKRKAGSLSPRRRLQKLCEKLKHEHNIVEAHSFPVPLVLDNITMDPSKSKPDMYVLNICPLSLSDLECMVANASRLLTDYPSLAKNFRKEAAVVHAYKDFYEIYFDVFRGWDRRMRYGDGYNDSEL